jgi:putative isomerase
MDNNKKYIHSDESLFSLYEVPFSYHGSWNSIKIPLDKDQIFYCSHHQSHNLLFPIEVIYNKKQIIPTITAKPHLLTLSHEKSYVKICFESTNTIRIISKGLELLIGERDLMYECGTNLFAINKPFTNRYQIEIFKGSGQLNQLVPTQPVYPKTLEIHLEENSPELEIAIDKFNSTWIRPERKPFEQCVNFAKEKFDKFIQAMPKVRDCDKIGNEIANYVNWATTVEPCGLVKRPTLLMSKFKMDNIWSWDHAFNAIALSKAHPKLAIDQMLTMIDHQDEFGCFPDSFRDLKITYNFSKPPVHGWAFGEMLKRFSKKPNAEIIETMVTSLSAQVNWWMTHRVLEGKRLPYYLHGNDSGWDNSTMFKKGVPLESPDLSALLITQMDQLAILTKQQNKTELSKQWSSRANELYENLIYELWSQDHFIARHGVTNQVIESESLIPWLALILGKRLPEEIREYCATGIKKHLTDFGLATEHPDSEFYNEDGYWRGPIWAPSTLLAISGLERAGYEEIAIDIAQRFCKMGNISGFPENYNALTGEALRCPAYTWTSSVYLILADKLSQLTNN